MTSGRVAAVAAAVLVLAGCGGGGPSLDEFLAEADAVCKRANEFAHGLTAPTNVAALKELNLQLAGNVDRTRKELEGLGLPDGNAKARAEKLLSSMRHAAGAARGVAPAVDRTDLTAVEAEAQRAIDAFKAVDSDARAVGSRECGRGDADAAARMATALPGAVTAAYIAVADPLCRAAHKQLGDLSYDSEDLKELADTLAKEIAVDEKLVADIRAIPTPGTGKDKLDEWLRRYDEVIAEEKKALTAANAGNQRETDRLFESTDNLIDPLNAAANRYGFKECGSAGDE